MTSFRVIEGDVRTALGDLEAESVQTCITSPPYWGLRDYGTDSQLGLEPTPEEYVENLVAVFREVRRVLRDDGTLWLNLGDSYAGSWGAQSRPNGNDAKSNLDGGSMLSARQIEAHPKGQTHTGSLKNTPGLKGKDLVGIPWRVAFALQADGWYLRSDIIWHKPNPMPESVTDRPTKAHEYLFLLTKSPRYYYDADAIREGWADHRQGGSGTKSLAYSEQSGRNGDSGLGPAPAYSGRNRRTVWTVTTKPFSGAHFAVFPPDLIEPCVLAGSSPTACDECGAPRQRITERSVSHESGSAKAGATEIEGKQHDDRNDLGGTNDVRLGPTISVETLGWEPTCECDADDAPQIVLDPFTGSGTTGMVALRHGRDFVGTELNPEYAQMARDRIRDDAPLLNGEAAA